MPEGPPRLILGRFRPIDVARVLLVVLPAVPGLLFLVVGVMVDLHARTAAAGGSNRAVTQARELYLAGVVTLVAGTCGMAAVIWKIARTRPEEPEPPSPEHPPED